jgi:hypothetical protein
VIKPGKYTGVLLLVLSIVMMLDAFMAFVLGERYMYWGLDYMPAWYSTFIIKIYDSPRPVLWLFMLAEMVVGFGLFLLAQKSIRE